MLTAVSARAEDSWPDLSKPARATGGGAQDSAVIVGIESYFAVPGVPGAKANADEWYDYLTQTRGVPPQNVKLLTNSDATREDILGAAGQAARQAGSKGTLWFVFVGHGAASSDGKDGLLIGVDAQQKAESLQARSVRRGELLTALAGSPAGSIRVVLDACFSGRGPNGESIAPGLQPLVTVAAVGALDPRMAVLTAAKGNQFAGSLPGAERPAFSYLVLGGLRGWAAGPDGKVTAGSLWSYTKNALAATLRGRDQTPDLLGSEGAAMGASAGEMGPNLAALSKATAGGKVGRGFNVSALPAVPVVVAPERLDQAVSGLDLGSVDVAALEMYDTIATYEKGDGLAAEKAVRWRQLAAAAPQFTEMALKRAVQWEIFAAQQEAADAARWKRIDARDADWEKLSRLLALSVVSAKDKGDWSGQFVKAYLKSPGIEPPMAKALSRHTPGGAAQEALKKLSMKAPTEATPRQGRTASAPPVRAPKAEADIQWVRIPGGSFMMGTELKYESPRHRVTLKPFQLAKTEVTNKQYRACVTAGACSAPKEYWEGDEHPVVNVSWDQARIFSEWVGGRLPSEAEWEYAARSGGKDRTYPWGNAAVDGEKVTINATTTAPVCSKPAGNTEHGLCDMAGSVWEWVQDWSIATYEGAPTDGSARNVQNYPFETSRVSRGGSFSNGHGVETMSTTHRGMAIPADQVYTRGFRPARD